MRVTCRCVLGFYKGRRREEEGGGGGQVVGSRMWSPPGYDQPVPHLIVSPRADKKRMLVSMYVWITKDLKAIFVKKKSADRAKTKKGNIRNQAMIA